MYIAIVPNRNSPPAILLRESYREGKKVKNRTLANLSHLSDDMIDTLRRVFRGDKMVTAEEAVQTERTMPAGHVMAVLGTMKKLGMFELLSTRPSRERDLVAGMIVERILHPSSKLGTVRLWKSSILATELGVEDAEVDELYESLDWLLRNQGRIEEKLAKRHLSEGCLALYDLSNSHYEGRTCPLARIGHDKDGRRGASVIAYGLMTDREGRPVAMEVYPGNREDSSTVTDQIVKLRLRFGLERVVFVGDRGTLTGAKVRELRQGIGLGWITALRSEGIRKLVEGGVLQMSLFDERDIAEIESPDYPGERLVACFNPFLAEERGRKREELLKATEGHLERVASEVARSRTPMKAATIGLKVGRVINRFKVAKHFDIDIKDGCFTFARNESSIRLESELDGIYVLRTSEPTERMSAEDTVRSYKMLSEVEKAFRCLKGTDLRVRPIFHRTEDHVRAHFFLCMLAYYVEWHMRQALAPLLYQDEELSRLRPLRDPVKRPESSSSAKGKKGRGKTAGGFPVHSFSTLLAEMATQARVRYRVGNSEATFDQLAPPTPLQHRAFELLGL